MPGVSSGQLQPRQTGLSPASSLGPPRTLRAFRAPLLKQETLQAPGKASLVFYTPPAAFSSRASAVVRQLLLPMACAPAWGGSCPAIPPLQQLGMALLASLGGGTIQKLWCCCHTNSDESSGISNGASTSGEERVCQQLVHMVQVLLPALSHMSPTSGLCIRRTGRYLPQREEQTPGKQPLKARCVKANRS